MVKLMINNVAGLNSQGKLTAALTKARSYDVILYQETKLRRRKLNEIRAKWGHPDVFMASCQGDISRRGVLTLFSPNFNVQHLECIEDNEGQYLINLVSHHTTNIMIVNFYGDPESDHNALQTLRRLETAINDLAQQYQIQEKIIGGDFNFVVDDNDTSSGTIRPNTEALWLTMEADLEIYDLAVLFTQTPERTYFRHRMEWTNARYDRFYTSHGLLTGAELKILPRVGDHAPVELKVLETEMGHKPWRIDDGTLDSTNGVESVHAIIGEALREYVDDPEEEVDVVELQHFIDFELHRPLDVLTRVITLLRNKLKEITRTNQIARRRKEKHLIDNLIHKRAQHTSLNTPESLEELEDARTRLNLHQTQRAATAAENSFVRYARAGERVTNYHFSIQNRNRVARTIRELHVPDNNAVNQLRTINSCEVVNFMSQKFGEIAREDQTVGNTSIGQFLGQTLSDEATKCPAHLTDMLDAELTSEQLKNAVDKMKNKSCPGPLGLSNRLLKIMFPLIQEVLVKAGNALLFSDAPPEIPRWLFHRTVVFIPKPGKSPTSEDSYRGLSMLENIFKMYSTEMASRMARILKLTQDPEQYGFTEGKSCMEPTRTIIDTILHANQNNQPLVVLSTDLYKAFDTISLDHIERSLDFFEFPAKYKNAFMRLARNGTLQFEINGHLSEDFHLNRGTGQGDPKSSFCFNMCVTPLNLYLSRSPEVPRYRTGEVEVGPAYFADDNGCLFDGANVQGILRTVEKIVAYKDVSGLELNPTKCEFLAVNCPQETIDQLCRIGMKQVPRLKHLGVIIEQSGEVLEEHNFRPIIDKMERIARRFATLTSTPLGRALYAKFLLGSLYVHRLQNGLIGDQTMQHMTEALLYMTWTRARMTEDQLGYRVHVAKARVIQPPSYGGLYLPSPGIQNTTLRILWLRKFTEEYSSQGWFKLLTQELERLRRPSITAHMRLGTKEWRKTATKLEERAPYWANVFKAGERIQELTIKQNKLWHMIPIFGSSEGDDTVTMGSLEHDNPMARPIMNSQLAVVGQLFKVNRVGQIIASTLKTRDEVSQEFRGIDQTLWTSMVGLVNSVKRRFRLTIQAEAAIQTRETALVSLVRQYSKGCSAANRLLLRAEREQWPQGEVPPSHRTYLQDGVTQIDKNSFMKAFTSLYKSDLLPAVKWTSLQVLLRTLWTKVKESRSRGGDDRCLNCELEPEHAAHMLFQCNLATGVLQKLATCINHVTDDDIDLTLDAVLFHHFPNCRDKQVKSTLIDVMMITKHVLYRLRFRENIDRHPTVKLVIITVIIEIQKYILLKTRNGDDTEMLKSINLKLRQEINWTT